MKTYNDNLHSHAKPGIYENAKELRQNQTKAEEVLWGNLRGRKLTNLKFRRQHPFEIFILDFYCYELRLCIEAGGGIHKEKSIIEYDQNRSRLLNENGIMVLRFTNDEIINDVDEVLNKIITFIKKHENTNL